MTKIPTALNDLASVLNNATTFDPDGPVGDGVALTSCGGPHFAPLNPKLGDVFYCAIGEVTYVYEENIGHAGWKVSDKIVTHPTVTEAEDDRIRAGVAKLMGYTEE